MVKKKEDQVKVKLSEAPPTEQEIAEERKHLFKVISKIMSKNAPTSKTFIVIKKPAKIKDILPKHVRLRVRQEETENFVLAEMSPVDISRHIPLCCFKKKIEKKVPRMDLRTIIGCETLAMFKSASHHGLPKQHSDAGPNVTHKRQPTELRTDPYKRQFDELADGLNDLAIDKNNSDSPEDEL